MAECRLCIDHLALPLESLAVMPAEVVDLLSSSPIAVHSHLPATGHNPPIPGLLGSARHDAESLSVTPDCPPQGAATLSSSLQFPDFPVISSSLPDPRQITSLPNGAVRTGGTEVLFLSDDFDTTGDLEPHTAKRLRLSTSVLRHTRSEMIGASSNVTWDSPTITSQRRIDSPPRNDVDAPSQQLPDDFISSDPFATSPPKIPSSKKAPTLLDILPTLSSDPFSSPPRLAKTRESTSAVSRLLPPSNKSGSGVPSAKSIVDTIDLSSDVDDVPVRPAPASSKGKGKGKELAGWDPISSSIPELRSRRSFSPAQAAKGNTAIIVEDASSSDSDALPDLADVDFATIDHKYTLGKSPPPKSSHAQSGPAPKKTTEAKELDKVTKAQAKEAEKNRKRVEKEQAKSLKAAEKVKQKALEEVNKKRTNHKISTPEMIVDLPSSLRVPLKLQIETLLSDLGVDFQSYHSATDNVVKWRRKVASVFVPEEAIWKDIPPRILAEEHILVILEAAEFVKLALGTDKQTLQAHVASVRAIVPKASVIYIIEGLNAWMRKNRNIKNRRYIESVRSQEVEPPSAQARKRKAPVQEYVDEDSVEDALLELQVVHDVLIHQTGAMVETAQWVSIFTQHISTVPYRRAQAESSDAGFCMEAGQVRTGQDSKDTYVRMLQEIARITAPIAYGIVAEFPSLGQLIDGLERKGPLALAECRKSANQDGAFSDRKIGPAVSKRVHKIFTGQDPGSTDV